MVAVASFFLCLSLCLLQVDPVRLHEFIQVGVTGGAVVLGHGPKVDLLADGVTSYSRITELRHYGTPAVQ